MRRQTLFLVPAFLVALSVSLVIAYQTLQPVRALHQAGSWRPASVLGLTLEVPADLSAPATVPGDPWTVLEFRTGVLGVLRIGRERPRGDLQGALRDWFGLPGPLDAPVTYQFQGQPAQARPVTVSGPAGHWLHRQGRQLVAACVFDQDGYRYWIQCRTSGATSATLACFHRVLLSLRGPGLPAADPRLGGELRAAEAGLAPGLVQGQAWTAAIPVGAITLALVLVLAVGRRSGRPPRPPEGAGASYAEAPVEVLLAFQLQRKYFDAALAVLDDRLVLYTFGTPFLIVPLDAMRGKVAEKTGWFGPPSLEIALEGALDYRKVGRLYGAWKGRTRLRIYTRDLRRLRVALGS
jgi:hypothetical protein